MAEFPDRSEVTLKLDKMKNENSKNDYLNSVLSEIPEEPINTKSFTDLDSFFNADSHALIAGRTGYGKTTLIITLLKKFIDSGRKVLYRDPAGDEFCYLSKYYPTQIFIPEQADISIELIGFKAKIVKTNEPNEIIEKTYNNNYPVNAMLYDSYTKDPTIIAKFYSELFLQLIHNCMQTRRSQRSELLFAIDELNDLVPPHGRGVTKTHSSLARIFEYNIRKLRKYKVRVLGITQRFNQLSIDVRSQFDNTFIKKSYGFDAWSFFAHQLITANSKTFWKVMRHIVGMPVEEFMFFDKNARFDFYRFSDIPRPPVEVELLGDWQGIPEPDNKKRVRYDIHERTVKINYLKNKGYTDNQIAKTLGITYSDVVNAINRINTMTQDLF